MRVLIVSGTSLKNGYGIEKFIETLATSRYLTDVDFSIIYPYFKKSEIFTIDGYNINYIPIFLPIPTKWPGGKTLQIALFNFTVFLKLIFNRKKFEILHTNGEKGGLAFLIKKKGTVFTIHGYSFDSFRNSKSSLPLFRRITILIWALYASIIEKLSYKLSQAPVQIGNSSGAHFRLWSPVTKVNTISNGVKMPDLIAGARGEIKEKYGIGEKCLIALWVGGDPERKGLYDALKAVEGQEKVVLSIIGCNPQTKVMDNVIVAGRVSADELHRWYSAADLLIFPSKYEALPFVVLESISYGIPVIGLKKAFMYDIFGSDYPLLCDDSSELSVKIKDIAENVEFFNKMRDLVIGVSRHFTAEGMAQSYHEIYTRLCQED